MVALEETWVWGQRRTTVHLQDGLYKNDTCHLMFPPQEIIQGGMGPKPEAIVCWTPRTLHEPSGARHRSHT